MAELLHLLDDGANDGWIGVADAHRQHAAKGVEVALAGIVPDVIPLPLYQLDRLLIIHRDSREQVLFMLADGFAHGRSSVKCPGPIAGAQTTAVPRTRSDTSSADESSAPIRRG